MASGRIKWLDRYKGFGIIVPNDGSEEVFVCLKDVPVGTCCNELCNEEHVTYEVCTTDRTRRAENVQSVEHVLSKAQ